MDEKKTVSDERLERIRKRIEKYKTLTGAVDFLISIPDMEHLLTLLDQRTRQVRKEALEEAASIAEDFPGLIVNGEPVLGIEVAKEIRALIEEVGGAEHEEDARAEEDLRGQH